MLPRDVVGYLLSFDSRFVLQRGGNIRFVNKINESHYKAIDSRSQRFYHAVDNMTYVILPVAVGRYFHVATPGVVKEIHIRCCHVTGDTEYDMVTVDTKGHTEAEPLLEMYM